MLEDDFTPDIVERLRQELSRFSGKCYYDSEIRKIVYHNLQDAESSYLQLEAEEMEKHKWIESEKAKKDLGDKAVFDWIKKHALEFSRSWGRTHTYIPSEKKLVSAFNINS